MATFVETGRPAEWFTVSPKPAANGARKIVAVGKNYRKHVAETAQIGAAKFCFVWSSRCPWTSHLRHLRHLRHLSDGSFPCFLFPMNSSFEIVKNQQEVGIEAIFQAPGSSKDEKFISEGPKVPVLFLKPTTSYLPMGALAKEVI